MTPEPRAARLLTLEEAQSILGVSRTTLWRWLRDGFLERREEGGRPMVRRSDVLRLRAVARAVARGERGGNHVGLEDGAGRAEGTGREKPELVTFDEAAEFFRTSRRTIERWVKAGILPVVSLGGRRLFLREDLLQVAREARGQGRGR